MKPAEIARQLGIRYQHAYNVVNAGKPESAMQRSPQFKRHAGGDPGQKPSLTAEMLIAGGFRQVSRWALLEGELVLETPVPRDVGVYAFVKCGVALYVGVATMGLSKRLYFYGRPGTSQRTSQRLHATIKAELSGPDPVEVYVASPPDLEWNSLPVHGSAGLELGLIKKFALPWNMRSANAQG
jgi:hypothetical protein